MGLDFDWITHNLYVVSEGGYVFACKSTKRGSMNCYIIVTGQGRIYGIAVDPNHGYDLSYE